MSSSTRHLLEQSVAELDDLQKKGLFERKEITMIMRRRTDFEHRILGRGGKARDFLKYAEFEMNLEKLRLKRFHRLSLVGLVDLKPSVSDWAGFKRIVYIFDRATRRFPADLDIWTRYIQFAKEKDAIKIVYRVYAKLLQLQPRNVDAWISAAKYEFETNYNAKGARDLFQRALRLNPENEKLWLTYAQFELTYVSKLLARRKVLGLMTEKQQQDDIQAQRSELESRIAKMDEIDEANDNDGLEANKDVIGLDSDKDAMQSELAQLPEADMNVLGNPDLNPVLKGDIALTVFDLCVSEMMKHVDRASREAETFRIAEDFFSMFSKFDNMNRDYLNYHVLAYLQTHYSSNIKTTLIDITLPLRNVAVGDQNLAEALQLSVNKYMAYKLKLKSASEKTELSNVFVAYLNEKYVNSEESRSEQVNVLLKAIIQKCR
ncbi:hypothetical protein PUMCH_004918 [Australozyma saopauloensis]|uniref:U3 small nucleolar RNA-associated protein 6 N-terminal domain-containing protein n=1 Tax=Australozyma saopauloensis TaxID=291208 RepID=A0AAX4HGJ9_9ASCO|nr:hypothetical protein PUMCH_004918 [[Candida] saopauloensis]